MVPLGTWEDRGDRFLIKPAPYGPIVPPSPSANSSSRGQRARGGAGRSPGLCSAQSSPARKTIKCLWGQERAGMTSHFSFSAIIILTCGEPVQKALQLHISTFLFFFFPALKEQHHQTKNSETKNEPKNVRASNNGYVQPCRWYVVMLWQPLTSLHVRHAC